MKEGFEADILLPYYYMFHSPHVALRGLLVGIVVMMVGLASVAVFQFARSGEAWEQWRAGRLSASSFYFQRGNYYFGGTTYDIDRALANFQKAASYENTQNDPILYQIGRVYFIQGRLDLALTEFDRQLEENPDYKRTYYMRGLTYGYLNRFAEAEADFETYLEWRPGSWAAYNDIAWVFFRSGQYQKAEDAARKGLEIEPMNPWLSNALGAILVNQERYEEAEQLLIDAQIGFSLLGPEGWGVAYPGNDPRIYAQGHQASIASAEENLRIVRENLKSE